MNLFSFEQYAQELCCYVLLNVMLCVNIVPNEIGAVTCVQHCALPIEGAVRFTIRATCSGEYPGIASVSRELLIPDLESSFKKVCSPIPAMINIRRSSV